jgi:hypothetical protein
MVTRLGMIANLPKAPILGTDLRDPQSVTGQSSGSDLDRSKLCPVAALSTITIGAVTIGPNISLGVTFWRLAR